MDFKEKLNKILNKIDISITENIKNYDTECLP